MMGGTRNIDPTKSATSKAGGPTKAEVEEAVKDLPPRQERLVRDALADNPQLSIDEALAMLREAGM